jgi:hypothetical protein
MLQIQDKNDTSYSSDPVFTVGSLTRSDWLSITGILVSVLGFGVGLYQLRKTAKAAEAARDAVSSGSRIHLLFLLSQFHSFESELDSAIYYDDRLGAGRILASVANHCNSIAAVLRSHEIAEETTALAFGSCALAAGAAKGKLISTDAKIARLVADPQKQILGLKGTIATLQADQGKKLNFKEQRP